METLDFVRTWAAVVTAGRGNPAFPALGRLPSQRGMETPSSSGRPGKRFPPRREMETPSSQDLGGSSSFRNMETVSSINFGDFGRVATWNPKFGAGNGDPRGPRN